MAIKTFYLVGENPVEDSAELDVDVHSNIEALKEVIAPTFSICETDGIAFQSQKNGEALEDFDSILDNDGPIGITIDGHAVREIPGPEGKPIVGSYYDVYPDHLGNHERFFKTYGPVFKETNLGRTMHFTNDPRVAYHAFSETEYFSKFINENHPLYVVKDNVGSLFLGDTETENWHIAHSFVPTALAPKAIRHHMPVFQDVIEKAFTIFDQLDRDHEAINVYQYMQKLACQAVGQVVMGLDFNHFETKDSPLHKLPAYVFQLLQTNRVIGTYGNWYQWLPFGLVPKLKAKQKEALIAYITAMKGRPQNPDLPMQEAAIQSTDFWDYLARATNAKGEKVPPRNRPHLLLIIAAAGFSTTSSMLSWLTFALAKFPGNQERILQEIINLDINADTKWDADQVNSMSFMDKFLKETLRLFASNAQPVRVCRKTCILPGGYRMHEGQGINPNSYHIHVNENVWTNPRHFDPDRWDTPEAKERHKCAWVPFAYGPRSCIGFNFAFLEMRFFIAKLVYRYEFSLADDAPIQYDPNFVPPRPMNLYVRLKPRTTWPAKSKLVDIPAPVKVPEGTELPTFEAQPTPEVAGGETIAETTTLPVQTVPIAA